MQQALLLRLFESQFFNSWIAVSYLFKYSNHIGIQEYLCLRLAEFPIDEIQFLLPQLWYTIRNILAALSPNTLLFVSHLLVTMNEASSASLEFLLLQLCQSSMHFASLVSRLTFPSRLDPSTLDALVLGKLLQ